MSGNKINITPGNSGAKHQAESAKGFINKIKFK